MPDYFVPEERVKNILYAMEGVVNMLDELDTSTPAYKTLNDTLYALSNMLVKPFVVVENKTDI